MSKRGTLEIKYVLPYDKYSAGYVWKIKISDATISKTKYTRYASWDSADRAAKRIAKLLNIDLQTGKK